MNAVRADLYSTYEDKKSDDDIRLSQEQLQFEEGLDLGAIQTAAIGGS